LRAQERLRSTQTRRPGGAVESAQQVMFPRAVVEHSQAGAQRLGDLYWRELRRATLGVMRTTQCHGELQIRLLGRGPALLRFGYPEQAIAANSVRCSYAILGGLLARAPAGSIRFT
jgi:hypothetical protein